MNHIEGYQTKITPKRCKNNESSRPAITQKEINWLMDCPVEYYTKKYARREKVC